jgi:F0F1-type ATP synthase membrane subunit c/vacuolar-type H+-ATPase subunit K
MNRRQAIMDRTTTACTRRAALTAALATTAACGSALAQGAASANALNQEERQPLVLDKMGSFMFGGTTITSPTGETFHGDHGYAQYLIPQNARQYPLVMWHGLGQSGKTWESTPDGREGFQQIFARRGWPVYIIDQPRRGRAGRATVLDPEPPTNPTLQAESEAWNTFRLGVWTPPQRRTFFPGVQFSRDWPSINQFLRQQTPNTGAEPFPSAEHRDFLGTTVARLFHRIGPGVLVTHSHSGQYGWATVMKAPNLVKAVVAYESGEFSFPENELPPDVPTAHPDWGSILAPQPVPMSEFMKLTRIPIQLVYGDNITSIPSDIFGAVCRRREPPWRKCSVHRAPAAWHPWQHAFPDVGPQQSTDREPAVAIPAQHWTRSA